MESSECSFRELGLWKGWRVYVGLKHDKKQSPGRRVTSTDVAKAAVVSRATVSYVLNDVPGSGISEATRDLVLTKARELGHVPYAPARSLRSGRSNIVLALVRDFSVGYISDSLLRRLDSALTERGYVVLVHRLDEKVRSLTELWGLVTPAMVVTLGGLEIEDDTAIRNTDSKLFQVHGMVPHVEAGRMQARYLHSKGHRRLGYGFPAAPALELVATERLEGVRRECELMGLPEPELRIIDKEKAETAFAALESWTSAKEPVTAVCAHNDELAILLVNALAAGNKQAGKNFAVIGVDNLPEARIGLTTVEIDVNALADALVERALATLDDREFASPAKTFLRLIERESA